MGRRIKPQEVKIITKEGECSVNITLDLNINITADGLKVSAEAGAAEPEEAKPTPKEWVIPEFGPSPKINFGKREELCQ